MIAATVAMAGMALLFVVFGVWALADGRACDGHCSGCGMHCESRIDSPASFDGDARGGDALGEGGVRP